MPERALRVWEDVEARCHHRGDAVARMVACEGAVAGARGIMGTVGDG
jgi:hypothetical protein